MEGELRAAGRSCVVRPLLAAEVADSAALHVRELPGGFFPALGQRFLRRYHQSFVDSPYAVAYAAHGQGRLDGFLLGVLDPRQHGAYVLRHRGLQLGLAALLALLVRPRMLVLFLRTRLRRYARGLWRRAAPRRSSPGGSSAGISAAGAGAVLSHVAVRHDCRGTGAGAALVARLHEDARAAGCSAVVLLTSDDGPGPGFYRRLGYADEGTVVGADGHPWRRFRWRVA